MAHLDISPALAQQLEAYARQRGASLDTLLSSYLALQDMPEIHQFFELASDILCVADLSGHFLMINPAFERILGYSFNDIKDIPSRQLMHPEDVDRSVAAMRSLLETRVIQHFENRYRCQDGSYCWLQWTATLDKSGQRVYAVARDITDQKATALQRERDRQFIRKIADRVPFLVYIYDIQTNQILYLNHYALDFLGYTEEAARTQENFAQAAIHPDHLSTFENVLSQAKQASDSDILSDELRVKHASGDWRWVRASSVIFARDEAGQPIQLLGAAIDVTQQRQMEAALRESEERYRTVVASLSEGIILQSLDGQIIETNPSTARILALSTAQLAGQVSVPAGWQAIREDGTPFPADWSPARILLQVARSDSNTIMGVRRREADPIWIAANAEPLLDAETDTPYGMVISFSDISAYKRAKEAEKDAEMLRLALQKEKELREVKSHIISMVAHDFRTPMAVIMTATGLLRMHTGQLSRAEQVERLNKIDRQVQILNRMIEEMALLNRGDRWQPLRSEVVNICRWLNQIVDDTRLLADGEIELQVICPDDMPSLRLDVALLERIVYNLVSNAIKFSLPGGTVRVICELVGEQLRLTVSDDGIGIPKEDQAHIFETFRRGGNVGAVSGTGLGLVIVKQAVEAYEGTLDFTSQEGEGSTFTVAIPLDQQALV